MDFIGLNEFSYVKTEGSKWQIGLFKLNGLNPADNSIIYEKTESLPFIDVSPLSRKEFILFYKKGNNVFLSYLSISSPKEDILLELPSAGTDNEKVAASPEGNYAYLLYNNSLRIFDIASKTQIGEISQVNSAVWMGDSYILYSAGEGSFVYSLENKEKEKLSKIASVSDLSFNPKDGGVIVYTEQGNAKAASCKNWQVLGSTQAARIKALANEKTAILEKDDSVGYWRFKNADWTVRLSENFLRFATVWNRY